MTYEGVDEFRAFVARGYLCNALEFRKNLGRRDILKILDANHTAARKARAILLRHLCVARTTMGDSSANRPASIITNHPSRAESSSRHPAMRSRIPIRYRDRLYGKRERFHLRSLPDHFLNSEIENRGFEFTYAGKDSLCLRT